jgi:hypothetical protein
MVTSSLMMSQARALGIGNAAARFASALMRHRQGRSLEVLNKPDKLTDDEFAIMKRRAVDGAEFSAARRTFLRWLR